MASGRINAIKQYNEDLVTSYVDNYREVDQMHGAYDNYAMMILDWAGNRDIMKAPQFRIDFRKYLDARAQKKGIEYSDNYIYSVCLFVRDFFRYCKAELPADDTALITEFWLQNLVPNRKTAKRISFSWLSDEDLEKIIDYQPDTFRLKRAKMSILLAAVTGMSRTAILSVPIREISFPKKTVNQYPARGVYTEKLASGKTHIFPDQQILDFLQKYTAEIKKESPADCTWFIRLNKHGIPQPKAFGPITEDNRDKAYRFAISPYGRLKEDLLQISEACGIPKITMTIAQNTFIRKRLEMGSDKYAMKEIAKDLLIKDITPISRCKELMGTEKRMVFK